LYDYYGFPQNTYNLNWKVNSDKNKSKYISEILEKNVIKNIFDENRDFDHGVFVPFIVAF
jgi:aromatic ring-opening dioxygenase catalytic subunit (LigB family)